MTPASPRFVSAELDVDFGGTTPDAIARTCEALRAFRVIGLIDDDSEGRAGSVSGMLAFVPGQGLLVQTADGVAPTPVQPVIDAVSARLGADVVFASGDEEFIAAAATAVVDDEVVTPELVDTVFVVGGDLPLGADRRAEIAHQLEADVVAAPLGRHTLVATSRRAPFAYWARSQRPVIAVQRTENSLAVHIYSTHAVRTGRMRERLTMAGIPDWMALWDHAPIPLVASDDGGSAVAVEVQARLLHERQATIRSLALTDPAVLAETQVDAPALKALLSRPLDTTLVAEVVAALRLPSEVGAVVNGEREASSLPGAVTIEDRGLKGVMSDTLYAEPEGTSFWTRWRRLPHRHPRAAAALVCGELAVAGALAWSATVLGWPQPWWAVSWVVAGVLAIDGIGDAFLLWKIRRLTTD